MLAEGAREPVIRRWLAGYTRLERVVSDSSTLPVSRSDFDELFGLPEAPNDTLCVARVSAPEYRRQDLWVACDFQLLPHLGDLLLEARQLGHPVVAQINLTNFAASEDHVREALRNAVDWPSRRAHRQDCWSCRIAWRAASRTRRTFWRSISAHRRPA